MGPLISPPNSPRETLPQTFQTRGRDHGRSHFTQSQIDQPFGEPGVAHQIQTRGCMRSEILTRRPIVQTRILRPESPGGVLSHL